MDSSDDELDEQLEMLPTHSGARKPNVHDQTIPFSRFCIAHRGLTFLLVIAGIVSVVYLFWPGPTWLHRPTSPDSDNGSPIHDPLWSSRAVSVKEAFLHAYGGYEKYTTFPDDELRPVSNSGQRK